MNCLELERYRFRFTALDGIRFPAGKAGNVVRGAFGLALRDTASAAVYEHLFEPKATRGEGPSGLADRPRPYVFRLPRRRGSSALHPGEHWDVTLHLFDRSPALPGCFQDAMARWKKSGIGPGRGRLRLDGMEQLEGAMISLDSWEKRVARADVHFWTPTELKVGGQVAGRPEFPILFGRLRDRIATLCSLYQGRPLEIDFRGLGSGPNGWRWAGASSTGSGWSEPRAAPGRRIRLGASLAAWNIGANCRSSCRGCGQANSQGLAGRRLGERAKLVWRRTDQRNVSPRPRRNSIVMLVAGRHRLQSWVAWPPR